MAQDFGVKRQPDPGLMDYLRSIASVQLGATPRSLADTGIRAGRAIGEYALGTTPSDFGQQSLAVAKAVPRAQYQASMWLGGGETTGLGSAGEPFVGTFESRVRYTADRLGLDPERVLEMMLRGEIPLLAEGGAVNKERLAVR